jgi:putative salt-induced outer membrane protein YdiY
MPPLKSLIQISIWLTLVVNHLVLADQVLLKNGDIITGEIVKKETEKLVFKTSYAGEINIQWSEISKLTSEEPQQIVLTDGSVVKGRIESPEAGEGRIVTEKNERVFNLNETRYINPSVDLAGLGTRWSGHINAGGTITQGNSDTQSIRFDGETIARKQFSRYTLGGVFNHAEDQGSNTQFNSRAYGKYDYFFSPRWYGYVNQSLENDRFRDLRLRSVSGAGSGYQIFETPNINLALEGGLNYISENYYQTEAARYPAVRWAIKYDQLLFRNDTRFFHEHEVLLGLQERSQTLFSSKTGLRFPLLFGFNATTQLNFDWDSQPSPGRSRDDSTLLFTLGYGW